MSMPWTCSRRADRAARRQLERRRKFSIESLEGRQMLSIATSPPRAAPGAGGQTFTVTNTADSGTNSLRWAITAVQRPPALTRSTSPSPALPPDHQPPVGPAGHHLPGDHRRHQ